MMYTIRKILKVVAVASFVSILFVQSMNVFAISKGSLNSLLNNRPFYNPDALAGVCSAGNTTGLPGAQALSQQTQLDPKWQQVILKYASQAGTDPVAMASLLFWENAGFPAYKTSGWAASPNVGSGPWQITAGTWPPSAGNYAAGAQDPEISTRVAADIVKNYGGTAAGNAMGSIDQDFGKGTDIASMATVAKNYNAGQGTYRAPGVAGYKQAGRQWLKPGGGWGATKETIIDNYIVGMTYVYYQIATGKPVAPFTNADAYAAVALTKQDEIKQYSSGTGTPDSSGTTNPSFSNCNTGDGAVSGSIILTALNFAWDTDNHGKNESDAKPSYQVGMPRYNGSTTDDPFSDCGVFVSTVMHASGADLDYPLRGTGVQKDYLQSSPKYQVLNDVSNTAQMEPGDIMVYNVGAAGHTLIYVGPHSGAGGDFIAVDASLNDHVPQIQQNITWMLSRPGVIVARLKNG